MAEVPSSPRPGEATLPNGARCLNCRYLLDGLLRPVCPECGHAFDPTDRSTYFRPGQASWTRRLRRWASPPGLVHGGACVVVLASLPEVVWDPIIQGRDVRFDNSTAVWGLIWIGVGLTCVYLLRGLATSIWGTIGHRPGRWRVRVGWATLPLCIFLAFATAFRPIRFMVSRPMLLMKSREVLSTGRNDNSLQWIGLYRFKRVSLGPNSEVRFDFAVPRWEMNSILYSHDPPEHICRELVRLAPDWYVITW